MNGKVIKPGNHLRIGYEQHETGTDLIIWLKHKGSEKLEIDIESIPELAGDDLEDAIAHALRNALESVRDQIRPTLGQKHVFGE